MIWYTNGPRARVALTNRSFQKNFWIGPSAVVRPACPAFGPPGKPAIAGSETPCGALLSRFAFDASIRRTSKPTQPASFLSKVHATRITSWFEKALHFVGTRV